MTCDLDAPSIEGEWCCVCGGYATNRHHVFPKGMGGSREEGPTVTVCGFGNAGGCHGRLHDHTLHLRYRDGQWEWLATRSPVKYATALEMDGWRVCRKQH